jgi:hypothetical protein
MLLLGWLAGAGVDEVLGCSPARCCCISPLFSFSFSFSFFLILFSGLNFQFEFSSVLNNFEGDSLS